MLELLQHCFYYEPLRRGGGVFKSSDCLGDSRPPSPLRQPSAPLPGSQCYPQAHTFRSNDNVSPHSHTFRFQDVPLPERPAPRVSRSQSVNPFTYQISIFLMLQREVSRS